MSHFYNQEISDVDFILHIDKKGRLSLRSIGSDENKNVSYIVEKYFKGGRHFNSAGEQLFTDNSHQIENEKQSIKIIKRLIIKR